MPNRPQRQQQNQHIRHHIRRSRKRIRSVDIDAMTGQFAMPRFPHGRALEDGDEEGGEVEQEVAPDEDVGGPEDGFGLGFVGREDVDDLQEEDGFGEPDHGAVDYGDDPADLEFSFSCPS